MLDALLGRLSHMRVARVHAQSPHRAALADVPPELFGYWQKTAFIEFAGIPRDALFFANATDGLLTYFACVRDSDVPCALPSKAADSVWHAWKEIASDGLDAFCRKHFGRAIPHVEAARMEGDMGTALAACLVSARKLEGLRLAGANVPRLFALDRILHMPHGFGYRIARGKVAYANLDAGGKEQGALHFNAMLAPEMMLAAGVLPLAAYEAEARRQASASSSGSGGGADSGVSSSASSSCDSSTSSSCDSGGSSCGSSCGGGGGCGSS